jgi:hypothetical protein
MNTSTVCLLTIMSASLTCTAAPGPAALAVSSTASVGHPNAQYALSVGRPNAAPAESAPEGFFTASDAVAKARTQVERELAFLGTGGGSSVGSSLIVPRKESDPKAMADTEEDLAVMSHLLDKAATSKDEKGAHAMGITVHNSFRSGSIPRNLYLEGYGALFFLNVNFPLVPPAAKKDDSQTKDESNTEWENARRELFQPSSYSSEFPKFYAFDTDGAYAFSSNGQAEEYDADKVNDLKNNLIGALKNAANIRKLGNDETVTIIVTGRANESKTSPRKTGGASTTDRSANVWTTTRPGGTSDAKGTRLILRVRKSDIEAFQKQKTTIEDFRKQVTIMTY